MRTKSWTIEVQIGVRMYSMEEKSFFLETMIRGAMHAKAASELPGWPSGTTLCKWMGQARRGEIPIPKDLLKSYSPAFAPHRRVDAKTKRRGIAMYAAGRRPAEIARALGRSRSGGIRVWWKRALETGELPTDKLGHKPYNPGGGKDCPMVSKKDVPPEVAALSAAELENACLRAVLADLKAGGFDLLSISNRKKVELGERLRRESGRALREITGFLRISKSSYEYHRARLDRPDKYRLVRAAVREEFQRDGGRFGYRTVWARLRRRDAPIRVSEKVVRRIMAEEGLVAATARRRRSRWSSYGGEISEAPANLVGRNFRANAPDRLWLTDITEFRLPDQRQPKVYLSPVIDCFDGMPVSWSVGTRPTQDLVNSSLESACATRRAVARTIIHSGRGAHYRWPGWVRICEENGLVRSMSRKGCSPDNSACEGFFGRMENEMFYGRPWGGKTAQGLMDEIDAYMDYYARERPKRSLG